MAWQDVLHIGIPQMTFTWLGRCSSRRHPKAWEDVDVIDMDGQMSFTSHDKGMSYIRNKKKFSVIFRNSCMAAQEHTQHNSFTLDLFFGQFGSLRCAIKLAKVKFNSAAD